MIVDAAGPNFQFGEVVVLHESGIFIVIFIAIIGSMGAGFSGNMKMGILMAGKLGEGRIPLFCGLVYERMRKDSCFCLVLNEHCWL